MNKEFIMYNSPDKVKVTTIALDGFNLNLQKAFSNEVLVEIRIYTDNAKVRIYKRKIIEKITKAIEEKNKLILDFLPKRITSNFTNRIKVSFFTLPKFNGKDK